jgi:hypothetical protein
VWVPYVKIRSAQACARRTPAWNRTARSAQHSARGYQPETWQPGMDGLEGDGSHIILRQVQATDGITVRRAVQSKQETGHFALVTGGAPALAGSVAVRGSCKSLLGTKRSTGPLDLLQEAPKNVPSARINHLIIITY